MRKNPTITIICKTCGKLWKPFHSMNSFFRNYILNKGWKSSGIIGEGGKAQVSTIALLGIIAIGLLIMGFIENASVEILGGIIGGTVVLILPLIYRHFRGLFQIRFIDPDEIVTTENMKLYTAIEVPIGKSKARFSIRPRQGVLLNGLNLTFFELGKVPLTKGRRCLMEAITVTDARYLPNGKWKHLPIETSDHVYVSFPEKSLASGKRIMFEIDIKANQHMKSWQGIMGIQILFMRDGNPDRRNVHTKAIVYSQKQYKPLRAIGKKILFIPEQKSSLDTPSSQT